MNGAAAGRAAAGSQAGIDIVVPPWLSFRMSRMINVLPATSDAEIEACFDVLKVLRPHLEKNELVARVRRQESQGYRLVCVREANRVVSAAGYRLADFLAWGRVLYVDDLVTLPEKRGLGYAGALLDWLMAHAKIEQCDELHLDSGHQRHEAHRLYLGRKLQIGCHHFAIKLKAASPLG
jgi:GNAT superfamily N-acetyltransferase